MCSEFGQYELDAPMNVLEWTRQKVGALLSSGVRAGRVEERTIRHMTVFIGTVWFISLLLTACGSQPFGGLRPTARQFSSQWVDITLGGIIGLPDQGPALHLELQNKSKDAIWVTVDFQSPAPNQACTVTKELPGAGSQKYTCPQRALVAHVDYPIQISIFLDKDRAKLAEVARTKFRFSERDAAGFEALMKTLGKP